MWDTWSWKIWCIWFIWRLNEYWCVFIRVLFVLFKFWKIFIDFLHFLFSFYCFRLDQPVTSSTSGMDSKKVRIKYFVLLYNVNNSIAAKLSNGFRFYLYISSNNVSDLSSNLFPSLMFLHRAAYFNSINP